MAFMLQDLIKASSNPKRSVLCDSHLTGVKTETQNSVRLLARKAGAGILSFPVTPDLVSQAACSLPQKHHDLSREMPGLWSQMAEGP